MPEDEEQKALLPRHDPLLIIELLFNGISLPVKALIDSGASAPIISLKLAEKLGWQQKASIQLTQADGTKLESSKVVSTQFNIGSCTFQLDAEVLTNMGNRQLILGLSWLRENGFMINPVKRTLEHTTGYSIKCSELNLSKITIIEGDLDIKEDDCIMILNVASEYPRYMRLFSKELANKLPPHRKWDHEILLKDPNAKIPNGIIYKTTLEEEEALRRYLHEMVSCGKVRRSRSATAAPVLFVKKKNGELRLCVDYRAINKLTSPNRYRLPRIDELQEKVKDAKWFTRLDLKNGYNLVRIKSGDEWKTAFKTKLGLYEYTVMPFGLMNAPSSFQEMMDEIL